MSGLVEVLALELHAAHVGIPWSFDLAGLTPCAYCTGMAEKSADRLTDFLRAVAADEGVRERVAAINNHLDNEVLERTNFEHVVATYEEHVTATLTAFLDHLDHGRAGDAGEREGASDARGSDLRGEQGAKVPESHASTAGVSAARGGCEHLNPAMLPGDRWLCRDCSQQGPWAERPWAHSAEETVSRVSGAGSDGEGLQ